MPHAADTLPAVAVPADVEAERQLAGAAVSNPGHARGFELVDPDDFYVPAYSRIVAGRVDLAEVPTLDARVALAAELGEVPVSVVEELVSSTGTMFAFARHARAVRRAARRRRAMELLAEAFNATGAGAGPGEVAAILQDVAALLVEMSA